LIIAVSIKASAAREVDALIADLTGPNAVAREGATARLTVIGSRAVERLLRVVQSSSIPPVARVSALRALEGIRDPRTLGPALEATADPDPSVAIAGIATARVFIRQEKGADIVDRLTSLALDAFCPDAVRLAAIAALRDLGQATVAPLLKALAGDAKAAIRAEATRSAKTVRSAAAPPSRREDADAMLARAAEERLPDDPDQLREALASAGRTVPLAQLLRIAERIREGETAEPDRLRESWAAARAAAHLALARRRSRVGVYDLREWLESTRTPLPVDAFAALAIVGDRSCLEPIVSRYAASRDEWSKTRLADMFRAIVKREAISRRHAAIKRLERRQKRALDELWPR
jgi:hypothetical protein